MKKLIIPIVIILASCTASRPVVQQPNGNTDTIYVDHVMMASKKFPSVPVKTGGYIIHKGDKYYVNGREASLWKYEPTNRKRFAPHSKTNDHE